MCGFCAVFTGIPHWTETASDAGDQEDAADSHTRRLARQRRVALINTVLAHYGCRIDDWMSGQYLVSSQRGRTEIVNQLPEVWRVVEDIAQRSLDPLDPALLASLHPPSPNP